MPVRPATRNDLEAVLALVEERPYPALGLRGQTSDQRRRAMADSYREHWEWVETDPNLSVLITPDRSGFAIMVTGLVEAITDEPKAILHDLYARSPHDRRDLLEACEGIARVKGARHLTMELVPGESELERLLEQHGYHVEVSRILRRVTEADPRPYLHHIRRARPNDHLFIVWLSGQTGLNTVPAGRSQSGEEIAAGFFTKYLSQDFAENPDLVTFVAQEADGPRQLGYIIVKYGFRDVVDNQGLAYIYDLAVHPDFWGKRVVHDLMLAVDRFLVEQGITLLQGDISQTNQRALLTATRALKFTVEWRRWAKNVEASFFFET